MQSVGLLSLSRMHQDAFAFMQLTLNGSDNAVCMLTLGFEVTKRHYLQMQNTKKYKMSNRH